MWVLSIVILIAQGAEPSQFKTVTYPTREACVQAQAQIERKPFTFGYCDYERVKTK